jgi:hypothetical protein
VNSVMIGVVVLLVHAAVDVIATLYVLANEEPPAWRDI